jgi:hypothetical protein
MDREGMLAAARSLAERLEEAPSIRQFRKETGVKDSWWQGKYWSRWSDLLAEAGIEAKAWAVPSLDLDLALRKYWEFVAELGAIPVQAQLELRRRSDPDCPLPKSLRRNFGSDLIPKALEHAKANDAPEHVMSILRNVMMERSIPVAETNDEDETATGFVYLMKSGKHYKIGKTNAVDRRQYEIGLQLPEKLEAVHSIETDDPSGIEAYWHNRFKNKRLNGEWFDLSAADVRAFKKRKRFM